MFDDDLEPAAKAQETWPKNLENLSVSELEEYIDELRAEIRRVEEDIEKKSASKEAADSVFRN